MNNIVDTVEDRIQNAILVPIDIVVAPKIELAIKLINASCGRDVTSVAEKSECWEHIEINASFGKASGKNNVQQISNGNDETQNYTPDEVSELSVPEARFDRQTHSHHMVTGQTTQTNQIPEFLTQRISTPRNPPSTQYQNLSTQVSQHNDLPTVEQTPRNQNSDSNNTIICLATQQRPQAATMLRPVSTSKLIFDGKMEKLNFLKTYFIQCLKCNQR